MSFIIDNKIVNHDLINYNYSELILEPVYYKNIPLNGYIHIPIQINKNNNFISSINIPERFIPKSLYIVNKSCEIQNVSFDAELVLENISYTNSKKMYIRFPLKYKNTETINTIDDIIKQTYSSPITFDLNKLLKADQKCIFYEDPYLTQIVLFTEPIYINTDVSKINWNNTDIPFQPVSNIYTVLNARKNTKTNTDMVTIKEGFQEGLSSTDTTVMDCQLVDTADDEIATYTVPIDGNVSHLYTDMFNMKIITDFILFLIIIILTYVFVPFLYSGLLVNNIISNQNVNKFSYRKLLNYIESSIRCIILVFGILLFMCGTSFKNTTEIMVGAFIIFFLFTCFIFIKYYKETDVVIKKWPQDNEGSSFSSGLLNGYGRMIINMFSLDTVDTTVIAFIIILFIVNIILYFFTNTINENIFVTFVIVLLFLGWPLASLIKGIKEPEQYFDL
jgi:hypothetical protein